MGLLDALSNLASALGFDIGGSDWQSRLKGEIVLTSPKSKKFTALWISDSRSMSKKLGLFSFPGIKGTKAQDLEVDGVSYSIPIYFYGPDNDKTAKSFFTACGEKGPWKIQHPNLGPLELQLVSVRQNNDPIQSGNITKFDLEWIEPLKDSKSLSLPQLGGDVKEAGLLANIAAAAQFGASVVQDTFSQFEALVGAVGQAVTATKQVMSAAENFELVPAELEATLAGITSTIASFPLNTDLLAAQVQRLVQLYGEAQNSTSEAIAQYSDLIDYANGISPTQPTTEGKNIAAAKELLLSAAIVGIANSTLIGGEKTRSESLSNIELLGSAFTNITTSLDSIQTLFEGSNIELQYFSQSQSYADSLVVSALASKLLLLQTFNLAIEKRFTLAEPRNPVEITATEYGSLGDGDGFLDLFLLSNDVEGSGFFVLPAGREVVVYV